MSDPSEPKHSKILQLLGIMLMAIGGMIAVLSGLCSLAYMASMFRTSGAGESFFALPFTLVVGGVPIAVGVGVFFGGWKLYKRH